MKLFISFLVSGLAALSAATAIPATPPTFYENVAPVIYGRCTGCHRPGEAAPFSLMSYEDVAKRGRLIATVTAARYMPPWKAEPASYPYRDDRSLTAAEIALIQDWVKQGMPQGDPAKAPPVPEFKSGWQLGTPDLVVELPEAFPVPAAGPDIYRYFVIPVQLPSDRWIQAIELRPTARKVVHHVLFFADPSGEARSFYANQPAGHGGMRLTKGIVPLGGWAVGAQPHLMPDGLALKFPKGSDLVFQYHFHPNGKTEAEKTVVGLYFAKKPPEHTLVNLQVPPVFGVFSGIDIPAGAKDYRIRDSYTLPTDVQAISVGAHSHYLGKTLQLTATLPSGEVKTLVSIKDWDFAWQDRYFFRDPVSLPKGTRLDSEISWDNSSDNPRNPSNPPVEVKFGEQSTDEMGSTLLQVIPERESDLAMLQSSIHDHVRQLAIARMAVDPELRKRIMERRAGSGQGQ